MAYGFEDDKSKYDIANIPTDREIAFTPNADLTNIELSDVQCLAHGTSGLIAGAVSFRDVNSAVWYVLGTITGVQVANQVCAMTWATQGIYHWNPSVRVDTDGTVRFTPRNTASGSGNATCSFNIMFRVAPA